MRLSSTHSRTARSSEPWCSAITPAQSDRASSSAWYQTSDCERVLVKTSVVLLLSISRITCGSIVSPRWPLHGKRSTRLGNSESTISSLGTAPRTSVPSRVEAPSSVRMASCKLPSVADMPQTHNAGFHVRSRASANCTCTPRLLPSRSCHSSTTTIRTLPSTSLASARVSISDRLSGVVTSSVGKRRFWALRSAAAVSPLRAPADQSGASASSGCTNARKVSAARARIGVIHSTVSRGAVFLRDAGAEEAAVSAFDLAVFGGAAKASNAPSHTA